MVFLIIYLIVCLTQIKKIQLLSTKKKNPLIIHVVEGCD